jgi:cytochrome P450
MVTTERDDNLLTDEAVRDPYPLLDRLRETAPVHYNDRYRSWMLLRYEHVAPALKELRFRSDRITPFIENRLEADAPDDVVTTFRVLQGWMVFVDPPKHARLRKLVSRAFTPRAIAALEGRITEIVEELVGKLPREGEVDLVREFAYPLPAIVIAEMLGVPPEDRDLFKSWSDDLSALVFGELEDDARHTRAAASMVALVEYLEQLCHRYSAAPDDNIISALVQAREGGDALTQDEVIATCVLLLFGGHETTTSLIGNAVLALSHAPEVQRRARNSERVLRLAVEEAVRFDGPAKFVPRVIEEPFEFAGQAFEPGQRVLLSLAAANRDPRVYDDPETFRPERDSLQQHVGYGLGPHYCLGAPLARLEVRLALEALLGAYGHITAIDSDVSWAPVLLNRVIRTLPAEVAGVGRA